MKTYLVGRESDCNVVISDPTQMVSRHHATINVNGRKMTIIDSSSNGTKINGIRISPNTPVPVSRKDVVSFADTAELDWSQIPDTSKKNTIIIMLACLAGVALACGIVYYFNKEKEKELQHAESVQKDSLNTANSIAVLEKRIVGIAEGLAHCQDSLTQIKTLAGKKDQSKLGEVNKMIWKIEEGLKDIDVTELNKSFDRLKQSFQDNAKNTPERLEALMGKVEDVTAGLAEVSGLEKKAFAELEKIGDAVKKKAERKDSSSVKPSKNEKKGNNRVFI